MCKYLLLFEQGKAKNCNNTEWNIFIAILTCLFLPTAHEFHSTFRQEVRLISLGFFTFLSVNSA